MGLLPASHLSLPLVFTGPRDRSTLGSWCFLMALGALHLFPASRLWATPGPVGCLGG